MTGYRETPTPPSDSGYASWDEFDLDAARLNKAFQRVERHQRHSVLRLTLNHPLVALVVVVLFAAGVLLVIGWPRL